MSENLINYLTVAAFIIGFPSLINSVYSKEKKEKIGIWLVRLQNTVRNPNTLTEVVLDGINNVFSKKVFSIFGASSVMMATSTICLLCLIYLIISWEFYLSIDAWIALAPVIIGFCFAVAFYSLPSDILSLGFTKFVLTRKNIWIYMALAPIDLFISIITTVYLFIIFNEWLSTWDEAYIIEEFVPLLQSVFSERYEKEMSSTINSFNVGMDGFKIGLEGIAFRLGIELPNEYLIDSKIENYWSIFKWLVVVIFAIPSLIFSALTSIITLICYSFAIVFYIMDIYFSKVLLGHFGFKPEKDPFVFIAISSLIIFSIFFLIGIYF